MNQDLSGVYAQIDHMQRTLDALLADSRSQAAPAADQAARKRLSDIEGQQIHILAQLGELRRTLAAKADMASVKAGDRNAMKTVIEAVGSKLGEVRDDAIEHTEKRLSQTLGQVHDAAVKASRAAVAQAESASAFLIDRASSLSR